MTNPGIPGALNGDPRSGLVALRVMGRLLWRLSNSSIRRGFAIALALVVCLAASAALSPYLLKLTIDSATRGTGAGNAQATLVLILAYVFVQGSLKAVVASREMTYGTAVQRLSRSFRRALFDHLASLPMTFHLRRKTGAVTETIEQGVRGVSMLLQHTIFTLLPALIEFGLVAFLLIHLHRTLYLLLLGVSAALYFGIFRRGAASAAEPATAGSAAQVDAAGALTEGLLNYETIKCCNAESVLEENYDRLLARAEDSWRCFYRRIGANGALIAIVFTSSLCACLLLAAREVAASTMTAGDFVLVTFYVLRTSLPLESMGYAVRDAMQGVSFLKKLVVLLEETPEAERGTRRLPARVTGELQFERVSFEYVPLQPVLEDISFHVPAGEVIAVVGESGAGKSTLARLILKFLHPSAGGILFDGVPVANLAARELRSAIAVVPQETPLFHASIAYNIGLGRAGATQMEVEQAAKQAHLHDFVMRLPDQYDTLVGERGVRLSGGERQRVAIARALIRGAPLVLCDEPTSSLDSETEARLLPELLNLARRQTTLCITHRLSIARHASAIVVLHRGRIVEHGSHAELVSLRGVYARLWAQSAASSVLERDCRPNEARVETRRA